MLRILKKERLVFIVSWSSTPPRLLRLPSRSKQKPHGTKRRNPCSTGFGQRANGLGLLCGAVISSKEPGNGSSDLLDTRTGSAKDHQSSFALAKVTFRICVQTDSSCSWSRKILPCVHLPSLDAEILLMEQVCALQSAQKISSAQHFVFLFQSRQ